MNANAILTKGPVRIDRSVLDEFRRLGYSKIGGFDEMFYLWLNRRKLTMPGLGRLIIRELLRKSHDSCKNGNSISEVWSDGFGRISHVGGGDKRDKLRHELLNRPELYDELVSEFLYNLDKKLVPLEIIGKDSALELIRELLKVADPDDDKKLFAHYVDYSDFEDHIRDVLTQYRWDETFITVLRRDVIDRLFSKDGYPQGIFQEFVQMAALGCCHKPEERLHQAMVELLENRLLKAGDTKSPYMYYSTGIEFALGLKDAKLAIKASRRHIRDMGKKQLIYLRGLAYDELNAAEFGELNLEISKCLAEKAR
jgi:hypothetical protein